MMTAVRRAVQAWGHDDRAVFLAFLAIGLVLYSAILELRPLRGDNLYVLAWVDQAAPEALISLDRRIYPEWRPLAYATIWVEHQVLQLRAVGVHHFINLLLLITCLWLVFRLVVELTGSRAAAFAAGTLLLIDRRSLESLFWIVERQGSMACLFGLGALLVVLRAGPELSRRRGVAVGLLLLASALSKEYGLAFAAALAVHGWQQQRRALVVASVAAPLAYVALRLAAIGMPAGQYCEEMGFFTAQRIVCMAPGSLTEWPQMVYNVLATGFGTALPGLLGENGVIHIRPLRLAFGVLLLATAVPGFLFGGPFVRSLAVLPIANALLSFVVFAQRNQLIATCAIAIASGVGLAAGQRWLARTGATPAWRAALVTLALTIAAGQALSSYQRVNVEVARLPEQDPCDAELRGRSFGDAFVKRVKATFDLPDPNCRKADAEAGGG
jgi:hypothetical protein